MMRILYVEDNPANLSLVERVARIGKHDVVTYMNGTSALENFERDKPDIVLMDIQLPGTLTGLDVVRRLRANGHDLPIIAVTAYAMVGDRERCLAAGCDGYIAKPLPIADLVALFEKYAGQFTPAPPAAAARTEPQPPARPEDEDIPSAVFIPKHADTVHLAEMDETRSAPPVRAKPADSSPALPDKPPAASEKGD